MTAKPRAPKWVTAAIPEADDYQLSNVTGGDVEALELTKREYKRLVWALATIRGHLQEDVQPDAAQG